MTASIARSLVLATALAATLGAATAAGAASKGRVRFDNLDPGPPSGGWFDLSGSELEFTPGSCTAAVTALLREEGPSLVHQMDDVVPEVKIELVGGKGNHVYYRATLSDVQVTKVVARTVWGSPVEDVELAPAQVRWQVFEQKADGSIDAGSVVVVDCDGGRT